MFHILHRRRKNRFAAVDRRMSRAVLPSSEKRWNYFDRGHFFRTVNTNAVIKTLSEWNATGGIFLSPIATARIGKNQLCWLEHAVQMSDAR